jgi:hypothetical protein
VQRDLLPLIEGTTVSTKYGPVKTDHILFIASGAFHVAKPSDLLPELQGRLPIRVELKGLTRDDLRRILTEPEANLIRQHQALMLTEGVTLVFTDDAIDAVAANGRRGRGGEQRVLEETSVENIGARRLTRPASSASGSNSTPRSSSRPKAIPTNRAPSGRSSRSRNTSATRKPSRSNSPPHKGDDQRPRGKLRGLFRGDFTAALCADPLSEWSRYGPLQ